jgi:peptidoglycan hydrolase-like protein with peptidoglycan-binding domain
MEGKPTETKKAFKEKVDMKGVGAAIAQLAETVKRQPLRRGSKNTAVKVLQQGLANKGFNPGYPDGIFGRKTALAVRNFQRASGLVVDSIVGPATWKALFG